MVSRPKILSGVVLFRGFVLLTYGFSGVFCALDFWKCLSLDLVLYLPNNDIVSKKPDVASEIVLMMSKITEHKLNGLYYLEWNKKIYVRSI